MADVAHDASGPASSEPTGIAQQVSGPATSDKGKLRVFISYSRDDLDFADQLDAALDLCGFECLIDRHGISGGEDWKLRLGNLISEADTVIFVLSPSSARSDICAWEVEESTRLNKRILPIICRPLEGVNPPPRLRDLNYIFFYTEPKVPGSGFGTGLVSLVAALNTDFDWLREHTRYLQRAMEWDKGGRPANRLLSGNDILEAKAWVARRPKGAPEPTALQLDFIRASEDEAETRLSEQRKQLEAMAAAQAERETALHDREEALKQRARVARVRNFALVAVSIFAVLAGWFGWRAQQNLILAEQQKQRAEQQKEQADDTMARALAIIQDELGRMGVETKQKVFALLTAGAKRGDASPMNALGWAYEVGFGVPQDYTKARELYEKAAAKDQADAMFNLGRLYEGGRGAPQDYAKAHEWYEKAGAKDQTVAMVNLGRLYADGLGVAQDYTKAREWYQKAADKGDAGAKVRIDTLPSSEAARAGRYAETLQLKLALAAKVEAEETIRESKPGKATAQVLNGVAWSALFAREFTKALTDSERAHALLPDDLVPETNRAHALMFLEREEEAKALYLANKGKRMSGQDSRLWEHVIVKDFAELRQAGLTHPMMADIEKELGVSPDGSADIGRR
jgi:TPR repeat protein